MRTTLLAALLLCSAAHAQPYDYYEPLGGQYTYVDGSTVYTGEWTTNGTWYSHKQYWDADTANINGDADFSNRDGALQLYHALGGIDSMSGHLDFNLGTDANWAELLSFNYAAPIGSTKYYLDGVELIPDSNIFRIDSGFHRLNWERPQGGTTYAMFRVREVPEPAGGVLLIGLLAFGATIYRRG